MILNDMRFLSSSILSSTAIFFFFKWQQHELLPRRMKSNIEASFRDIQRNTEVPKSRRSLALFSIG